MLIKAPRGTQDIFYPAITLWQRIEELALQVFQQAGFTEMRTPVFEATELFARAVGDDSDIVNKEMYTFHDRSDRSLTLRPEATASIVRSFIENGLQQTPKPQRFWYRGPMFRYERPQTGRYRQFHQIGLEAFGVSSTSIDVEVVTLALELFDRLGLTDITLCVNSIGNQASRSAYIAALKEFLAGHLTSVCTDCQRRFNENPLRMLDCKVVADQELYKQAPVIYDYFDEESLHIWSSLKNQLTSLGIKFQEDSRLVRGLDYYNHLVFEIKTHDPELGAQSTICGGGRYDALVAELGGNATPAVGFAIGEERLVHLLSKKAEVNNKFGIYIIGEDVLANQKLALGLRRDLSLIKVEYDYDGAKFKKQLEKALKTGSKWVIFYMEAERASNKFKIKNLETAQEFEGLSYDELLQYTKS